MPNKLTSPSILRAFLSEHGITPTRRWGQNFLVDENILRKICRAAEISPGDEVLEVGPGPGALTLALSELGAQVWAVELDRRLAELLQTTTNGLSVRVVQADALRWPWEEQLDPSCTKVVSNLPYYLTSPLLIRFLESSFPLMVLLVQHEVAQRLFASPGQADYSALSVRVAYHAEGEIVGRVSRNAFFPRPDVDSAIVRLRRRPHPAVEVDEAAFFAVVRAAFGHRRKILRGALSQGLSTSAAETAALLDQAGIDGGRRGETLSLEEFAALANALALSGRRA